MPFARPNKSAAPLDENALHEYAVKALGRRMRTIAELTRLMRAKVEAAPSGQAKIDSVLARLKEYGYIDDAGYAATYTKLRQENSSLGKRRVRQDLSIKGVQPELITQTLDAAYADVDEEALARRHLERKRVKKPANEKEAARVMRMLVRAGFSTGTIFKILKSWDVQDEALAGLESGAGDEPEEH